MESRHSDLPIESTPPGNRADLSRDRRTTERRASTRCAPADAVRDLVEQLTDGIVIVSDEGMILFANSAAEHLFGRRATELVGERIAAMPTQPRGNKPVGVRAHSLARCGRPVTLSD